MMAYLKLIQHTKETITPLLMWLPPPKTVESTREVVTYHHEEKRAGFGIFALYFGFFLICHLKQG